MAKHDIKIGVKVGVEGQESVTSAVKSVGDLSKALDKASGDAGEFSSGLRDMSKYTDAFDKIAESSKPLKSQLREMQKILGEMEFKGLSGTDEFIRMAEQAGGMRDAMDDAAASVRYFADDIKGISTAVGLFEGVAGAVSLAQGALALFGDENKEFEETMRKVQGAMALANGVQQVANTLNKNSTLVMGVANLQKRLAAKLARDHATAVVGETTATKGATLATKALNVVLKANPIGLVITAITTLIGLFAIFRGETEEATTELGKLEDGSNDLNTALGRQMEAQEETGKSAGELIGKYETLRMKYLACKSDMEITRFLQMNVDGFDSLGLNIKTAADAMDVFVKRTPQMRAALMQISVAKGAQKALEEYTSQWATAQAKNPVRLPVVNSGTRFRIQSFMSGKKDFRYDDDQSWLKEAGITSDMMTDVFGPDQTARLNATGLERARNYLREKEIKEQNIRQAEFKSVYDSLFDIVIKADEEAARLSERAGINYFNGEIISSKSTPSAKSGTPKTLKKDEIAKRSKIKPLQDKVKKELTELEKLEQQRDELQKRLQNPRLTEYERSEIQGQLDELQKDIEFKRKWTAERMHVLDLPANDFILTLDGEFDIDKKSFEKTMKDSVEQVSTTTTLNVDPRDYFTPLQWSTIQHKESALSNAQTGISQVQGWFDAGIIGKDKAQELIDAFNTQLKIEGLDPIEVKLDAEDAKATLQDIGSMWSSVKGVGDAVEQLTEGLSGNLSAWETIKLVMDSFLSAAQGIDGIVQLIDRFTESTKVSKTTTEANTKATQENTTSTIIDTAATKVKSQANAGEAVTNATKESTKVGWPGLLFAIPAALAAVMSALAMAGAFAEGGIVGGTQKQGDRLLARVNSGEMILNTRQQANLFRLLNSGIDGQRVRMPRAFINPLAVQPQQPQAVRFEIDGRKLVGVLSNETTISSRSGKRTNIRI